MFCNNCGKEIPEGNVFCANCGTSVPPAEAPVEPTPVAEPIPEPVVQAAPVPPAAPAPEQPRAYSSYNQNTYTYQQPAAPQEPVIPQEYKPLGPWAYIGWNLLFSIPLVGLILQIVFSFGGTQNLNLRNYSRSFLWAYVLAIGIGIVFGVIVFLLIMVLGASTPQIARAMY